MNFNQEPFPADITLLIQKCDAVLIIESVFVSSNTNYESFKLELKQKKKQE